MENISGIFWNVIINPVSGGKKAPGLWKKIRTLLNTANISYRENITAHTGHAISITKEIIQKGGKHILIIGGDGTANEVVNGIFAAGKNSADIIIAMVSAGTGNDWVRSIGRYNSLQSIAQNLLQPETFKHDAGHIEYMRDGRSAERYFINIAGLGFDGLTAKKVAEGGKFLHGAKLQYWIAIYKSLFTYRHTPVTYTVDGDKTVLNTLSVAAGICKYNGGGMMQLPAAEFNDGLLDMTVIGDMSKLKMVRSLPKLIDGSFLSMKEIKTFRGKEITIESETKIFMEADGEYLGETPVKITVLSSVLSILKWK